MKKENLKNENKRENLVEKIKNMDKKKKIIIGSVILAIIIIIILICLFCCNDKKKDSAIDKSLSTYQGKKIYEKDGNTIIEEENGSLTIETKKEETDYIEATKKIQKQYKISGVKVKKSGSSTIVTGTVKNVESKYTNAYVNVKFYNDQDEVIGSASTLVKDLKEKTEKKFEIKIVGNFSKSKYKVSIEYVS